MTLLVLVSTTALQTRKPSPFMRSCLFFEFYKTCLQALKIRFDKV